MFESDTTENTFFNGVTFSLEFSLAKKYLFQWRYFFSLILISKKNFWHVNCTLTQTFFGNRKRLALNLANYKNLVIKPDFICVVAL
jgi:hypothetical protein